VKLTPREITRIALFAALHVTAAVVLRFGGEAVVPFSALPFVAFLAAFVLGGRGGALSLLIYITLGLMGVPVFARPPYGGLVYVLQPTFGFLLGFMSAALVAGYVGIKTPLQRVLAVFLGVTTLYAVGLPYFYLVMRFYLGKPITFLWVIQVAAAPFILLDLIKAALAVALGTVINRQLKTTRPV
jgi:biotin transport system substrate-specific component